MPPVPASPPKVTAFVRFIRGAVSREPLLVLVTSSLLVATLWPLWSARFLPLTELPDLTARAAIWHRLGDPSWGLGEFYRRGGVPAPPLAWSLLVHLIAYVLPVESAVRVAISLHVASLPLAVLAFARRFDRSPWLSILAWPLSWSATLAAGQVPLCFAVTVMLLAIVFLDRFFDRPSSARLAGAALLSLLAFFFHPLSLVFLIPLGACVVASHAGAARAQAAAGAMLAFVAVFAIVDLVFANPNAPSLLRAGLSLPREPPIDALREIYHRILVAWPDKQDDLALMTLALSWLLLASTGGASSEAALLRLRAWIPELGFGLAALGYFLVPPAFGGQLQLNARLLPVAAMFGALLIRGPIFGLRRLLLVPAVAAAFAYPKYLGERFSDFDARVRPLPRLLSSRVPRGSSTLIVTLRDLTDPAVDPALEPLRDFHAWAPVFCGGDDPLLDDESPIVKVPGTQLPAVPRGVMLDRRTVIGWQYVLVGGELAPGQIFAAWGPDARRAEPVANEGGWRLYRIRPGK